MYRSSPAQGWGRRRTRWLFTQTRAVVHATPNLRTPHPVCDGLNEVRTREARIRRTTPPEVRVRLLDHDEDDVASIAVLDIVCLLREADLMTGASSLWNVHFERLVALRFATELTVSATRVAHLLQSPKRSHLDSSALAVACRAYIDAMIAIDHVAREPEGTHGARIELQERHLRASARAATRR